MDKYDFGNKLYEYRTQKGLTQKELGKLLGVTDKAVSKWETGESKPRLDKMTQITELFETSIDSMLGQEGSENGGHLKPYKTIFDSRLKKYSKYYKTSRIWTYIFAVICVALSALNSVSGILDGGWAAEKISSFIGILILTSAAVIFTLKFKPKFSECNSSDMNIFMGFLFALFLGIGVSIAIPVVKTGRITGEYDWFTVGVISAESLILFVSALIPLLKKRYYYLFGGMFCVLSGANIIAFDIFYYFVIYAVAAQFVCFIEKREWLLLADKADIEIRKTSESQKTANIVVAVIAVITVLSMVFSSFSTYFIYKICLKKYYPEYKQNEIIDYDYSAEFNESFTKIEFAGAKLKIPEGYEKINEYDNDFDGSKYVYYKNANNNVIQITYFPSGYGRYVDESDIEYLEPDEAEKIRADRVKTEFMDSLYKKYYGISTETYYGMKCILYFVDLEDVKFYESQKSALLIGVTVMKKVADTGHPMSASKFDDGMYCGLIGGYQMAISDNEVVHWVADIWHSNRTEDAYYSITYHERDNSDITNNEMICRLVNSLEF